MNYLNLLQTISHCNKYYTWYVNICQRALARGYIDTYTEKHHIIPKSLELGGEKDEKNLVVLTPREHYITHMLLVRFLSHDLHQKKMKYAMWYLSTRNVSYKPTSRSYETARLHLVATIKERSDSPETRGKKARPGILNGMYGKTHTDAVKQKIGQITKDRLSGKSYNELYGEEKAQELKKSRSEKLKLYLRNNPEARKGSNNANSKQYKITDPAGNIYYVTGGLKDFCRQHCVSIGAMIDLAKGRKDEYKGWRVQYL